MTQSSLKEKIDTFRSSPYEWIKTNRVMLSNASSLVGTAGITSILGFVYWWLAARAYPPVAVGFGSAAISAMTLIGTVCVLGFGTMLVGELPRHRGREGSLISSALIVVGVVAALSGLLFALIAPAVSSSFRPLSAHFDDVLLFTAGVCLTSMTLVFDQALIGLLRSDLQLWRNTLFAGGKLVALFLASIWLARKTGMTVYTTWMLGNALSLALLYGALLPRREALGSFRPQWHWLRNLGSTALQHHLLNMTLQAPVLILPVMVTVLLSATMNAWFYVAWMIANIGFLVPYILTTVLFAMASSQPQALAQKTRLTVSLAFLLCAVIMIGVLAEGRWVLGLFGRAYAVESSAMLIVLTLAVFPRIIKDHYIAVNRIRGKMTHAALPMLIGGLLELGLAALGAYIGGLLGLGLGYVFALCCEAAFGFPTVYRALK